MHPANSMPMEKDGVGGEGLGEAEISLVVRRPATLVGRSSSWEPG